METDLLTRIRGELERRIEELRPLCEEYQRLTEAATTLETVETAPPAPVESVPPTSAQPVKAVRQRAPKRTVSNEVGKAIVSALEHGSHTVSELVMVTARSPAEIRGGLSRLRRQRKVTKVKRPGDGKSAYALPLAGHA